MFALTHPNEAPPTHSPRQGRCPCQGLTSRHLVQAQRSSHATWNRAACTLPILLQETAGAQPRPCKGLSRGAPLCSWDPAQGVLNMQESKTLWEQLPKDLGVPLRAALVQPNFCGQIHRALCSCGNR